MMHGQTQIKFVVKCLFTYIITVQNVVNSVTGNIKFGALFVTIMSSNISTANTQCGVKFTVVHINLFQNVIGDIFGVTTLSFAAKASYEVEKGGAGT